jgi:hypothetical protein
MAWRWMRVAATVIVTGVLCVSGPLQRQLQADVQIFGPLCYDGACGSPFKCAGNGTYSVCYDFLWGGPGKPFWFGLTLNNFTNTCAAGQFWDSYMDGSCGTDSAGGQHMTQTGDAGGGGFFDHQSDGNAVLYDNFNNPVWHTHTNGWGANTQFVLTNGGDLVLYLGHSVPLWTVQ